MSNNIFIKIEGDAFTSAELISFLENKKAKEIVLVGLMAEKCIYNTAWVEKTKTMTLRLYPKGLLV